MWFTNFFCIVAARRFLFLILLTISYYYFRSRIINNTLILDKLCATSNYRPL